MPKGGHGRFDREQLDRELQDMLYEDRDAVLHALYCRRCESREVALQALALAGIDEQTYLMRCAELGGPRA